MPPAKGPRPKHPAALVRAGNVLPPHLEEEPLQAAASPPSGRAQSCLQRKDRHLRSWDGAWGESYLRVRPCSLLLKSFCSTFERAAHLHTLPHRLPPPSPAHLSIAWLWKWLAWWQGQLSSRSAWDAWLLLVQWGCPWTETFQGPEQTVQQPSSSAHEGTFRFSDGLSPGTTCRRTMAGKGSATISTQSGCCRKQDAGPLFA